MYCSTTGEDQVNTLPLLFIHTDIEQGVKLSRIPPFLISGLPVSEIRNVQSAMYLIRDAARQHRDPTPSARGLHIA
jgi:hypothetical protein